MLNTDTPPPPLWGTSRAARVIGLSEMRTRQLADAGKLRCIRMADGTRLYNPHDVERFAEERAERRSQ